MKIATLLAALLLWLPIGASAHLDDGEDKVVGDFLIDFGFQPTPVVAGQPATLAFNLVDRASGEVANFDSLWLRISRGDTVVYSGTQLQQARHVNLVHTFDEGGRYELLTRFSGSEGTLVETSFELPVDARQRPSGAGSSAAQFAAGIGAGIAIGVAVVTGRRKKKGEA